MKLISYDSTHVDAVEDDVDSQVVVSLEHGDEFSLIFDVAEFRPPLENGDADFPGRTLLRDGQAMEDVTGKRLV